MCSKSGTILNEAKNPRIHKDRRYNTSCSIKGIKANARIPVEQDADIVLNNLKLKILGQPLDDMLLTTDRRFKHYKANEDRTILENELLFRKNYGATGSVKYYQNIIPRQLVNGVIRSLHGKIGKQPGTTKTINAYRGKYYNIKKIQLIKERVMSCQECLRESRINRRVIRPPLQNPIEYITAPEVAMEND